MFFNPLLLSNSGGSSIRVNISEKDGVCGGYWEGYDSVHPFMEQGFHLREILQVKSTDRKPMSYLHQSPINPLLARTKLPLAHLPLTSLFWRTIPSTCQEIQRV
ncbi:hypothetical protein NPIL_582131 [Nephila pilipes]|uniref:Uncharacterized protein n=1 Tax=Nephila pilipes TaxID=299642 RepID=A0A8X6N8N8_NEPPI|nr:hypothetical protein NPIL_582131 [Nephila pilipes]